MDGKVRVNECEFAVVKSTLHKYENLGKNLAEPSANILHGFFFPSKLGKIVTVAHLGPLGAKQHSDETNDRVTPGL